MGPHECGPCGLGKPRETASARGRAWAVRRVLLRSASLGLSPNFQPISPRGRHNLCIGGRCGRRSWQLGPVAFRTAGSALFDPWDSSRFFAY